MTAIFWLTATLVVYPYFVYPLVLHALARARAGNTGQRQGDIPLPKVTLIISAYNEDAVIGAKLDNARALDYPPGKLQIIVISDASSDETDAIVERHADEDARVTLFRAPERRGKTMGLNGGMALATGDVVVFSDANAMYAGNAIRELVKAFAEERVGYVVGAALYSDSADGEAQQSEGLYWRYELMLKELESALGSVVGGDGAIYAIRRSLYWPLREDDINDFVNPLQIIAAGYRGVFNPEARCYEESAASFAKEFRRKRRIVNRSWRAVLRYGRGVLGAGNPAFVFQLASHKVLRWFAMPLILTCTAANALIVLGGGGAFYALTLGLILSSGALAFTGFLLDRAARPIPTIFYVPFYFYLVNLAAMLGIWDQSRGIRHSKWEHVRKAGT